MILIGMLLWRLLVGVPTLGAALAAALGAMTPQNAVGWPNSNGVRAVAGW
jgi:hypothetical protein